MKVVSITSRELKRMPILQLSNKIVNTEAKLYLYNYKAKWEHVREVLKMYYNQKEGYLADKMQVLSQLLAFASELDIPELVFPTALVSVDGNIEGFSMPLVENNVNLALILNNPKVKFEQKLKLLKEIYQILLKTMAIHELEGRFFLGDIHEANFILDIDEQVVKAVDLDSAYVSGGPIGISKVLTLNDKLLNNPLKYPHSLDEERPIPNRNTTILSFIYMLLNALSNDTNSHRWSMNEFYNYISFLEKTGLDNELVEAIANIYSATQTNELDIELLDSIDVNKDYTLKRARIHKSEQGYYG